MRHRILTVVLAGAVAGPAWAQSAADRYREPNEGGRYSAQAQGVPPGYLPPPGECRVWYDGRPAGYQPPATACAEAERAARSDRAARVIYGGDRGDANAALTRSAAYEQGFKDGRDGGSDDRRDDKRYDPTRHSRYQAADRGDLQGRGDVAEYRDGFRAGYAEGYSVRMTSRER
jgi:hypothetical protein